MQSVRPTLGKGDLIIMKHKLFILITTLTLISLTACGKKDKDSDRATASDATGYIITPTVMPEGAITGKFSENKNESITLLFEGYYSSIEEKSSTDIQRLLYTPGLYNDEDYLMFEDAEGITIKSIYTAEGKSPVNYVAYVYYDVKLKDVSSAIPSLDKFYVRVDDGTYYIINGKVPVTVYDEVNESLKDDPVIADLVNTVNAEFKAVYDGNSEVKEYLDSHKG